MLAIREIISRDMFENYEVPKEFGDRFEMILVPTSSLNDNEKLTDKEKWEKYGDWEPNSQTMDMSVDYAFDELNNIYDDEDFKKWQK